MPTLKKSKRGLAPGTLVHIGEKKIEQVRIAAIEYNATSATQKEVAAPTEFPDLNPSSVTWINVEGIHDTTLIKTLGERFQIHPLILEDIVNTEQRPKVEDHGSVVFAVLKMIQIDASSKKMMVEQVSILLGKNFVLSFQEGNPGDVFDPLRARIEKNIGRMRERGEDYLFYSLIDTIVDNAFLAIETLQSQVDLLQEEIFTSSKAQLPLRLHGLRQDVAHLRKLIWPLRELCGALLKENSSLIQEKTRIYFRDLYDHAIRIADGIQSISDMLSHLLEAYHIFTSHHLNQVMQVLTVITTIFMPLTFIVGVYGMNFRYMPELAWKWSYPLLLGFLLFVGIGLLWFFKRKRWL